MIIKYNIPKENFESIQKIWDQYVNVVEKVNKGSELFLYFFILVVPWVLQEESAGKYISSLFAIIMLIALYFRSYHYKLMTEPAMLAVDTKDQTVMVDDTKYKIKKMLLECNYFFIFFKRKVVILDMDKLAEVQKQEIISLFD